VAGQIPVNKIILHLRSICLLYADTNKIMNRN